MKPHLNNALGQLAWSALLSASSDGVAKQVQLCNQANGRWQLLARLHSFFITSTTTTTTATSWQAHLLQISLERRDEGGRKGEGDAGENRHPTCPEGCREEHSCE